MAGWTCTTPAVGANGRVSCSNPSVAVGSTNQWTLVANVPVAAAGTTISNTATVTTDPTSVPSPTQLGALLAALALLIAGIATQRRRALR